MNANVELTVEASTSRDMDVNQRYPIPGEFSVEVVTSEISEMEICSSNYNEPLELVVEVGGTAAGERPSCCNKIK
jgi:hypothetical protein